MGKIARIRVKENEEFSTQDPNAHVCLGCDPHTGQPLWVQPLSLYASHAVNAVLIARDMPYMRQGHMSRGTVWGINPLSTFTIYVAQDKRIHATMCLWHKWSARHIETLDSLLHSTLSADGIAWEEDQTNGARTLHDTPATHVKDHIWKDDAGRFWYSRIFESDISAHYHCWSCAYGRDVVPFNGSLVCALCGTTHYRCVDCDDICLHDRCESCEASYNDSCNDDDDDDADNHNNNLYDYSYKPRARFYGENSTHKKLFFGHEIEMVTRESGAVSALHVHSEIYCKYDGSLSGNGVEVVTHPMTYEYSIPMLHKICTIASDYRSKAYAASCSCGHHIHTPTTAWTDYAIHRALQAMSLPEWRDTMTFISQRDPAHLMRWAAPTSVTKRIATGIAVHKNGADTLGRYTAINVTSNTIEFRLFRSNLNPLRLIKNMQFVLVTYHLAHSLLPFTRENMITLAKQHGYSELLAFCKARKKTMDATRLDLSAINNDDI